MQIDFSIIIPIYNAENFLNRCIDSALNQKGITSEIILINDGSTDKSYEICMKYKNITDKIKLITQENKGLSEARNAGLDYASGDIAVFLDADDWISKDTLYIIKDIMNLHNLDVVGFKDSMHDVNQKFVCTRKPFSIQQNEIYTGMEYLKKFGMNMLPCVVLYAFRMTFINEFKIRFVKGVYHEDNAFLAEWFPKVNRVSFLNLNVYNTFLSNNSITRSNNIKKSTDLVKISDIVFKKSNLYDKELKKIMQNYVAYLAYAALHSCIRQKSSTKVIISNEDFRKIVLTNLKLNPRYFIVYLFVKLRMYNTTDCFIRSIDLIRNLRGQYED